MNILQIVIDNVRGEDKRVLFHQRFLKTYDVPHHNWKFSHRINRDNIRARIYLCKTCGTKAILRTTIPKLIYNEKICLQFSEKGSCDIVKMNNALG